MAGIVLHHADLHGSHKPIIEQGFREGTLHTIVSTTTLATGVNLPADSVVIHELGRSGYLLGKDKPLDDATLFNQVLVTLSSNGGVRVQTVVLVQFFLT